MFVKAASLISLVSRQARFNTYVKRGFHLSISHLSYMSFATAAACQHVCTRKLCKSQRHGNAVCIASLVTVTAQCEEHEQHMCWI